MTQYQRRIEHYGPSGLINVETPTFELTGEDEQRYLSPERLRTAYQTLRQWSLDAATTDAEWDTLTQAQKNVRLQLVIRRLGVFFDRFADLLLVDGKS
jgi:hypothetical protein